MRVLVLGIGSPFGEDRVGWDAVDRLREIMPAIENGEIEYQNLAHPTQLLEMVKGYDGVIILDALMDAEPGSLRKISLDELKASERASSHQLGVAEALSLARALGDLPEWQEIIGIGIKTGN